MNIRKLILELRALPESEFNIDFLQGMLDRMTVSYFKYGKVVDAYPHDISAIDSLKKRLDTYAETGNTEFLIDAANFAMIEFMRPSHPEAHFTPTDSDQSPGRVTTRGHTVDAPNNDRRIW